MNLRPLADHIVLKVIEAEEKTKGGIVLPDTAKERPQQGEVLAVGAGRRLEDGKTVPPAVKVGDKVLFSKYGGTEVKVGADEYLIVREDDILGVL